MGLDVNSADNNGNTALIAAAAGGKVDAVDLLVHRGAVLDRGNKDGATPLMMAAQANHTSAVRVLVKSGASIDATDSDGLTALMYAANTLANGCVRLLLRHRAKIDAQSSVGATALIYAVSSACEDFLPPSKNPTVHALLEAGADPALSDADGVSALIIAERSSATEYVRLLRTTLAKRTSTIDTA
jgi:ankyrin repeat protein